MRTLLKSCLVIFLVTLSCTASQKDSYIFEELAKPTLMSVSSLGIWAVTRNAEGRSFAWSEIIKKPGRQELVGIALDDGQIVTVDLSKYPDSNVPLFKGEDGHLYFYTGASEGGHFFKLDINTYELIDLGIPHPKTYYWQSGCFGKDGKFFVGTYPEARLVCCDTGTGQVEDLGRMSHTKNNMYLLNPAVSDNNVLYCPVGMAHPELWVYDVKKRTNTSGRYCQIHKWQTKSLDRNGWPCVW